MVQFNPDFDAALQATYGPDGQTQTVVRGYIVQDKAMPGQGKQGLKFLFNPSTVRVTYPSYEGNIAVSSGVDPTAPGLFRGVTNQILSFSLLFDRWAEAVGGGAGANGVNVDINQLKVMTGMETAQNFTTDRDNGGNTETLKTTGTGVPVFVPMRFYFGTSANSLRYFGSITEFSVEYTHWTHLMVPTRCAVEMTVALIPDTVEFSGSAGGDNGYNPDPLHDFGNNSALERLREVPN
ncbi:hypothetical protein [Nonomuraea sp. SYSU D8015]|uniref:hypothetical protein n=1 Tax=Nonomuraea sp. SYSU D8015 TaxID=2593644 RepID=UPI0016610CFA|nr:hypothetical protein [Nonomuraea sp. SYSU D8015]